MAVKAFNLMRMRTGTADFNQGSLKLNICLQLFSQWSLGGNKEVDAMRCPYKYLARKTTGGRGPLTAVSERSLSRFDKAVLAGARCDKAAQDLKIPFLVNLQPQTGG